MGTPARIVHAKSPDNQLAVWLQLQLQLRVQVHHTVIGINDVLIHSKKTL